MKAIRQQGGVQREGESEIGGSDRDVKMIARLEVAKIGCHAHLFCRRDGQAERPDQQHSDSCRVQTRCPCAQIERAGSEDPGSKIARADAVISLESRTGVYGVE